MPGTETITETGTVNDGTVAAQPVERNPTPDNQRRVHARAAPKFLQLPAAIPAMCLAVDVTRASVDTPGCTLVCSPLLMLAHCLPHLPSRRSFFFCD